MKRCPQCNTTYPDDVFFCGNCSTPLIQEAPAPSPEPTQVAPAFCPKCGSPVVNGAIFCPFCATKIGAPSTRLNPSFPSTRSSALSANAGKEFAKVFNVFKIYATKPGEAIDLIIKERSIATAVVFTLLAFAMTCIAGLITSISEIEELFGFFLLTIALSLVTTTIITVVAGALNKKRISLFSALSINSINTLISSTFLLLPSIFLESSPEAALILLAFVIFIKIYLSIASFSHVAGSLFESAKTFWVTTILAFVLKALEILILKSLAEDLLEEIIFSFLF